MMLPEIAGAVKGFLSRRAEESRMVTLDLKTSGMVPFEGGEWHKRNGFYETAEKWGSGDSWAGESVSVDSSLNHSVIFTCNRIISETMGTLPLDMMQKKGGETREATDKPMYLGLKQAPNDEQSAQTFRESRTSHCALGGNGYAQILRRSGTEVAYELQPIFPSQVTPDRDTKKRRVYVVKEGNAASKSYTIERGKAQDILHIPGIGWDGYIGYSVLTMARHSIGTALSTERNVGRFYGRGGRLPYNLKLAQDFEDENKADKFRGDWNRVYSNPHEAPILPPWLTYETTGISLADAQMLETRQFTVAEICRWFRISPHLAGDLTNANYSTIEQLALEFKNFTLNVWLNRWEQELWRCILTPEEKAQGYYFKHNANALLRGDFKTRMEGYSIALQNGFMSQNEVRDLEDWNGFEGGDDYHIQLNMQQLPTAPPAGSAPAGQQQQQGNGNLIKLGNGKKYRRVA